MEEYVVDHKSGLPENLLTVAVFSFFPTSDRHNMPFGGCYKLNDQYLRHVEGHNNCEIIESGSGPEYLWLPLIVEKKKDTHINIKSMPDNDQMTNLGWFEEFYNTMSLEIDEKESVFCKIKHGVNLDSITDEDIKQFLNDQYINSAMVNQDFREQMRKLQERRTADFLTQSFEVDQESPAFATTYTSGSDENGPHFMCLDDLFCMPVQLNETMKQTFLKRLDRTKWPLKNVTNLEKLLTKYVYVVPKPDKNQEKGDLRWRLSFSVLEVELARSFSETQRRCYRVLKAIIKYVVNLGLSETDKFPSYYLKTSFFWFCENTNSSWEISNLGKLWLQFLDLVIGSLENKTLPHFFVPSYNLMGNKDTKVVNSWKETLQQIRIKPLECFTKFWNKFLIFNKTEYWGAKMHLVLEDLAETYNNISSIKHLVRRNKEDKQLWNDFRKLLKSALANVVTLRYLTTQHLLSIYSLKDFLMFEQLYPMSKQLVPTEHATTKEHLIWTNYNQMYVFLSRRDKPDIYFPCWTQMAELTHHMVLKYGTKGVFSKETAERFHLISCIIQNKTNLNTGKFIKYANYLSTEKQYEDGVKMLTIVCQRRPQSQHLHTLYFSSLTSEVLDMCLKAELALQDETGHSQNYFAYHLLTSCYIQAGALATVCVPTDIDPAPESTAKVLLGFQLILSGKLFDALICFSDITENELQPFGIKYAAMVLIVAKIYSLYGTDNCKVAM